MTKRLKFVDGEPTIVDDTTTYIPFPSVNMYLDIVEHIKLGHCLCCGVNEYIGVSGNLILIYCTGEKDVKYDECDHRERYGCPGVSCCPRSHEFERGRSDKAIMTIEKIIGLLLELGPVIINNHGYIRHIISKWIEDEMYLINSFVLNESEDKSTKYYAIKLDDKVIEARDSQARYVEQYFFRSSKIGSSVIL